MDPALLPVNTNVVDEDCRGNTLTVNPDVPVEPVVPQVTILSVPTYGYRGYLRGQVTGVNPWQYKAVCYIHAWRGWWTKPYWRWPDSRLDGNGYFSCNVVTGGVDHTADEYRVFVVPIGYDTPLAYGGSIPARIVADAVASASLSRPAP